MMCHNLQQDGGGDRQKQRKWLKRKAEMDQRACLESNTIAVSASLKRE